MVLGSVGAGVGHVEPLEQGRLGDVVAGADLGLGRQRRHSGRGATTAGRQDQLLGVVGQVDAAGHHRSQHAVRRRVADQDPAEQAPPVVADHELLVEPGDRVGEDQLEGALGGGERVAERGHVDPEQLELGRHVGAHEASRPAEQGVDDHLGHVVAGRDQAVHPPAGGGALADRPDPLVAAAALLVDQHPAPLGDLEPGRAGQRIARTDAGREDHHLGLDPCPAGQGEPVDAVGAAHRLGGHTGVHPHAEALDVAHQRGAGRLVELHRHQPRRHLHDVGLEPELHERVGGLEAQQAAAHHDPGRGRAGRRPDRVEVLDGAVDEAAVEVVARHGRHEGRRARGQHQLVVAQHPAVGERDRAGGPVERGDLGAEQQLDRGVVVRAGGQQGELLGPARGEVRRQRHAVVGRSRLLADHDDVVGGGQPALDGGLHEAVADHAVADHDQAGAGGGARHRFFLTGAVPGAGLGWCGTA